MPLTDGEMVVRLLLATGIGALLGIEREIRHKSAGFRTNILIAIGACLFTLVALSFGGADAMRVPAQIVSGVGFLGAGAILHSREHIRGMTTAAMIWVNAALGTAVGAGRIRIALIGAFLTLVVLFILGPIERALETRNRSEPSA